LKRRKKTYQLEMTFKEDANVNYHHRSKGTVDSIQDESKIENDREEMEEDKNEE
jgi:hypothetical protein